MQAVNPTREERLRDELLQIRIEARNITQKDLAILAGVSISTIKAIARCDPRPKAETLKLIADGAASYAPGRRDEQLANEYYERLMRAAGYGAPAVTVESTQPADDTLKRQIEDAFGDDARQLEDFLIQASGYDREDKLFILQTVAWLKTLIPQGRGVRQRHALYPS